MAASIPTNSLLLQPDGTRTPIGCKNKVKSYKIQEYICDELDQLPYKNNGGVLVRILLDMYFKNQIPGAKMKFNKMVEEKKV